MAHPFVLTALLTSAVPLTAPAPEHVDQQAVASEAAQLELEGRYDAASEAFRPLADAFPQDYATQLRAAWLAFLAADYGEAEARYAQAIELSNGAGLARAGRAWTHLRQGRTRLARREFEDLVAEQPELAEAQAGLDELRRRRFVARPIAHGVGHIYAGHPTLNWAIGAAISVPMVIAEHAVLVPSYRYARFLPQTQGRGQGMMANADDEAFDQHEAHVGAGLTWPKVGVLGRYAYLDDGSLAHNHAHVLGLSLRYSPWGDGTLDASAAAFRSGWIGRLAPAWRMPLTAWMDLRPGLGLQLVDREVLPAGFGSLTFHGRPGAIAVGGKGGIEERPVYLEIPAIFAFEGRINWGAWLVGQVRLAKGWQLHASYETHNLRAPTATGGLANAQTHYIALGLSWSSAEAFAPR